MSWATTLAHPGNTDNQSGHTNRATGEYHFHTDTNQAVPKVSIQEKHWQKAFNDKVLHGQIEYQIAGKRVDILTPHFAVEVDWLHKWEEGVLQALEYARLTDRRPGLAIILEGEKLDTEKFKECQRVCQDRRVRLWVVNNHISVDDLGEVLLEEVNR